MTTGVVSAKGRSIGISDASFENFIQTDAAINFGNSGGPLINMQGQVVGIATAINWGAENIGFAVPVNTLKEILPQLREKGQGQPRLSRHRHPQPRLHAGAGLRPRRAPTAPWCSRSSHNAPAKEAGIQHGDVILSVDGRKVKQTRDLINYVSAKGPNATVTLDVWRDGKTIQKQVKLRERPRPGRGTRPTDRKPEGSGGIDWLGIQYQDLTSSLRSAHGIPERRGRRHRDQRHADQPALRAVRAAGQHHHRGQRPADQERRGLREGRSRVPSREATCASTPCSFDPRGGSAEPVLRRRAGAERPLGPVDRYR